MSRELREMLRENREIQRLKEIERKVSMTGPRRERGRSEYRTEYRINADLFQLTQISHPFRPHSGASKGKVTFAFQAV